jgi:hypothetical protein
MLLGYLLNAKETVFYILNRPRKLVKVITIEGFMNKGDNLFYSTTYKQKLIMVLLV